MDRDRIGKLKFIQKFIGVLYHSPFIKLYDHLFCEIIDLSYDSHISIENSKAFIHSESKFCTDFPRELVVILCLHNFIPLTEHRAAIFFLHFIIGRRIHISLQNPIHALYAKQSLAHWCQYLDIIRRRIHKLRQFLLNELQHHIDDHICVIPFQEKEIHALII